ncbi:MAG: hypothetical protein J6I84_03385 [Bacilli bacterium]|nr:hypothetical protein [Bacilli bacterium]
MNIAYKLSVVLPELGSLGKLENKNAILILPSDSKKITTSKIRNQERYASEYLPGAKWEKYEISNTEFKLSLVPRDSPLYKVKYVRSYLAIPVIISHPELDSKFPLPIITYITPSGLLNLISRAGYVSDGNIHGSFCCEEVSGESGNCLTHFQIEDPGNEELNEARGTGKLLATNTTSKWIPGKEYILPTHKTVIYLGPISKVHKTGGYMSKRGVVGSSSLVFDPFSSSSWLEGSETKGYLVLDPSLLERTKIQDFIIKEKGSGVKDVISRLIPYIINNSLKPEALGVYVGRLKQGAEVGEYFKNDLTSGETLDTLIKDPYTRAWISFGNPEYLSVVDPTQLSTIKNEEWKKIVSSNLISWIKRCSGWGSASKIFKKGMTAKDLISYSETQRYSSYYYQSSAALYREYYPGDFESFVQKVINDYFG